ncbi:hypothetical protein [Kitasatospora sp. NPDC059327]|uniref:hypothetical protein n=1 Tax=Kitasatospora sp. NPDC059327 TaxID=3346803 RepID=UPI0036BA778D
MTAPNTTHVVVGFNTSLLAELDRLLSPASVLVIEEPDVIEARAVEQHLKALP